MAIAYNPTNGLSFENLSKKDSFGKDIIFDLLGKSVYAKGTLVGKVYQEFQKSTSSTTGLSGLVPFPDYNDNSKTRFLREDGTWIVPNRPISINGTSILDNNNTALDLVAGNNITLNPEKDSNNKYTGKVIITASNHAWGNITGKPTTLAGYGITDAVDLTSDQTISGAKTFSNSTQIRSNIFGPFEIVRTNGAFGSAIKYSNNVEGCVGYIGIGGSGHTVPNQPFFDDCNTSYKIWHAGNMGEGSGLNADKLDGLHASNLWSSKGGYIESDTDIDVFTTRASGAYTVQHKGNSSTLFVFRDENYSWSSLSSLELYAPHYDISEGLKVRTSINNDRYSAWKTIAFTDSNITGNAATATWADKLDGLHKDDFQQAVYTYFPTSQGDDIANTTILANIIAPNLISDSDNFKFYDTKFYSSASSTSNRAQIAYGYRFDTIHFRRYYEGAWTDWKTVAFTDSNITGNAATASALKRNTMPADSNDLFDGRSPNQLLFFSEFSSATKNLPEEIGYDTALLHIGRYNSGTASQLYFGRSGNIHYRSSASGWKKIFFDNSNSLTPSGGTLTVDGDVRIKQSLYFSENARIKGKNGTNLLSEYSGSAVGLNTTNYDTYIDGKIIRLRYAGDQTAIKIDEDGAINLNTPTTIHSNFSTTNIIPLNKDFYDIGGLANGFNNIFARQYRYGYKYININYKKEPEWYRVWKQPTGASDTGLNTIISIFKNYYNSRPQTLTFLVSKGEYNKSFQITQLTGQIGLIKKIRCVSTSNGDFVDVCLENFQDSRDDFCVNGIGVGFAVDFEKVEEGETYLYSTELNIVDGFATNGNLTATSFSGNLDGSYINKLTGYIKAAAVSDITANDTLNAALGKLELKAGTAYDLVKGAYNGDGTIENLAEILKVLEGISDTDTIKSLLGKYRRLDKDEFYGSEVHSKFWTDRTIEGGGGWAYVPILVFKADKETKLLNIGVYGNNSDLIYSYIGSNDYHSTKNLRIYPDGTVTAPVFNGNLNYTNLTGSTTTANQAIVSNGTKDGWTLKTLGSNAFNSTEYLPLTGGTLIGDLIIKNSGINAATPYLKFQRGSINDSYIDWRLGSTNNGKLILQYNINESNATTETWNDVFVTTRTISTFNSALEVAGSLLTLGNSNRSTLIFKRPSANYIWADESGGYFVIGVKDTGSTSTDNASLIIIGNLVYPGKRNGVVSLGTSSYRWSNIYSVLGNFSGNVTAAGFVKSGSSDSHVLLGAGGHKALSDFLLETEFASKELGSNLTTITKTLVVSKDWVDTGIVFDTATFPNGTGSYIVQLSRDDLYYWTGCLSIVISNNVTASDSDEILLHGGGFDTGIQYYLRTVHDTTNKVVKLQIARNNTYSTSKTYTFKFKKLI